MKKLLLLIAFLIPFTASAVFIVDQGGTGSTTLSGILKGNGKSMVQTATAGTDYENPLTVVSPITRILNALGFDFSTQNTWTGHNIFSSLFATNASSTNATTTTQNITSLTSALVQADAQGDLEEYAGTTCTNQFVRVLSALGIATCESVDISADTNLTAGDALTLTGDDIDFDGGTIPAGALGGTWASPTVDDDGHNHTGATLSGIDISSDTNLSGDTEVVLTGDALSLGAGVTRDSELVGLGSKWATTSTWINPNVSGTGLIVNASSTIFSLNSNQSTSTSATSTDFFSTRALISTLIASALRVPSLTSALVLTNGSGDFAEYTGIDCTNQFVRDVSALGAGTCETIQTTDVASGIALDSELPVGSNPSATIGLTANNGVATSFMRSDATPALGVGITPTWTGLHIFSTAGIISNASSTIQNLFATNASTTNLIVSSAGAGTGCAQFSAGGTLSNTGVACGTGGGGSGNFSTTSDTFSIFNNWSHSFGLGTSTPSSKFGLLNLATTSGKHIFMNNGTYNLFSGIDASGNYNIGTTTGTGATTSEAMVTVLKDGGMIVRGKATSTLLTGLILQEGCVSIGGPNNCIGSGGTLTGVGIANRSSFWTSANNISYDDQYAWDNTNKRLGVGSSSPWAKLSVGSANSTTQIPLFAVGTSSVAISTSTAFFIGSNSNTVIGSATNTDAILTIATSTTFVHGLNDVLARLVGASGAPARMEMVTSNGTTNGSFINFVRTNGTLSAPTAVTADMVLGAIGASAYGTSAMNNNVGIWSIKAESTHTNTSAPTYQQWFTTPNQSLTALERMRITSSGTVAILSSLSVGSTTGSIYMADVRGRQSTGLSPSVDCIYPWLSGTALTADALGSATLLALGCRSTAQIDVNTDGTILAPASGGFASGTPQLQQMISGNTAGFAGNEIIMVKTIQELGSATSTLGMGIAMESVIRTPNVAVSTTSIQYLLGFSSVALGSLTTSASYNAATNQCLFSASSTDVWIMSCRVNGTEQTHVRTTWATSTTVFKVHLTLDQTGFKAYVNDNPIPVGTVPVASVPSYPMRGIIGVVSTSATAASGPLAGQGSMGTRNLAFWGESYPNWK